MGIVDRECVICGSTIPGSNDRRMVCGADCRRELIKVRGRQRAMRLRGERYSEDEGDPLSAPRRCRICRARLSLYNRGRYCNACWAGFSSAERHRIGGNG